MGPGRARSAIRPMTEEPNNDPAEEPTPPPKKRTTRKTAKKKAAKKPARPKRVRAKPYDATRDEGPIVEAPEPSAEPEAEPQPPREESPEERRGEPPEEARGETVGAEEAPPEPAPGTGAAGDPVEVPGAAPESPQPGGEADAADGPSDEGGEGGEDGDGDDPEGPHDHDHAGGAAPRNQAWPMACHLVTLISYVTPLANLGGLIAPVVLWQGFFRDDPDVEYAAKEAINFQVNVILWIVGGALLTLTCVLAPLGLLLVLVAEIANIGLTIHAAVKTAGGERYRYPYIWRPLETSQAQ